VVAPSPEHGLLIRQLETIIPISVSDRTAIAVLPFKTKDFRENRDLIREGSQPTDCCLILSGLVARYKIVASGRRQILSFHFPGDLPDLQSLTLERMDHGLTALTPTRAAFIPHEAVRSLIAEHASMREALVRHAMVDGSIFREWIANVGQRTALERVAHLICECFVRMQALGIVSRKTFELPLTQGELGDATGLSNVHVNRTMKELRRLGAIKTAGIVHSITDWDLLQETGDFDPNYLHLRPEAKS
jgi:CRP-like cAMP-binding protein